MKNIIENLDWYNEPGFAAGLAGFFNSMAMPLPLIDEYTRTVDIGGLVFLDQAACVIRFTQDAKWPRVHHPRVLQPVFSRMAGPFRAEIFPGISCPAMEQDIVEAFRHLLADKITIDDIREEYYGDNFGYLPESRYAVNIDMGALTEREGRYTPGPEEMELQEKWFGNLAAAFARAWPEAQAHPDRKQLSEAWALAAEMKRDGRLIANWQLPGKFPGNFKNMKEVGKNYAARWKFPVS